MSKDMIKKSKEEYKCLTVGELKKYLTDLPDNMLAYIVSDDEMPVRKLVGLSSNQIMGYFSELYLDTVEV